jgi:hypothetical protein
MDLIKFNELNEKILDTRARIQEGKDTMSAMRRAQEKRMKQRTCDYDRAKLELKERFAKEDIELTERYDRQMKQQLDINRTLSAELFRLEAELIVLRQSDAETECADD